MGKLIKRGIRLISKCNLYDKNVLTGSIVQRQIQRAETETKYSGAFDYFCFEISALENLDFHNVFAIDFACVLRNENV